jgi:hypothetical protein
MSTLQKELEYNLKSIRSGRDAIRVHLPPPSVTELMQNEESEEE